MVRYNHRHASETPTSIIYSLWLIFDISGSIRSHRGEAHLVAGERAMKLTVSVPKSVFKTPSLSGTITINDDQARDAIIAEVSYNAADVLREHMGVDLKIIVEPKREVPAP